MEIPWHPQLYLLDNKHVKLQPSIGVDRIWMLEAATTAESFLHPLRFEGVCATSPCSLRQHRPPLIGSFQRPAARLVSTSPCRFGRGYLTRRYGDEAVSESVMLHA